MPPRAGAPRLPRNKALWLLQEIFELYESAPLSPMQTIVCTGKGTAGMKTKTGLRPWRKDGHGEAVSIARTAPLDEALVGARSLRSRFSREAVRRIRTEALEPLPRIVPLVAFVRAKCGGVAGLEATFTRIRCQADWRTCHASSCSASIWCASVLLVAPVASKLA